MPRKRWLRAQRYVDARKRTFGEIPRRFESVNRKIEKASIELRGIGHLIQLSARQDSSGSNSVSTSDLTFRRADLQEALAKLRIEQRLLLKVLELGIPTDEQLKDEFEAFYSLHGVYFVDVVSDVDGDMILRVNVECENEYFGRIYDLGDWQFSVNLDRIAFESTWLRRALRPEWTPGSYPSYAMPDGSFCFGDNMTILRRLVDSCDYPQAAAVAVACFHSVNESDESDIPEAFYEKGSEYE
ncbi:MAG: hypothetical protein WAQ27_03560 [Candidatus Microsaccharimonas sp.]